jgi:hypothetical protein
VTEPETLAGQGLLRRHPELAADEVGEVERQARGQGIMAERDRTQRVLDLLHDRLTSDQVGAATAVLTLDSDVIASLDEATLGVVLAGLSDPRLTKRVSPEDREAARRFHDEIM